MAENFSTIGLTSSLNDVDKLVVGQTDLDRATTLSSLITYIEGKTLTLTGDLTAPTFIGDVTGHSSLDLPLTGGTLSGDLTAPTFIGDVTGHSSLDLPLTGGTLSGDLTSIDILPEMTGATGIVSVRNIGSTTQKFNAVYADEIFVGASSLYVNGKKVIEDNSSIMTFATDLDQGVTIKTTSETPGTGNGNLQLVSDNQIGVTAKGGFDVTVSTIASKNITFTNTSVGGDIIFNSGSDNIELIGAVTATSLAISGDLTVSGTTTTLNTETVTITDNIILINSSQTGTPATTLIGGIEIERGDEANYRFEFEELTDTFRIGEQGATQAVATRQNTPTTNGVAYWNATTLMFETEVGITYNSATNALTTTTFIGDVTGTASNADKLNNLDSTQFLRSDTNDIYSGVLTSSSQSDGLTFAHVSNATTPAFLTSGSRITGGSDYAGLDKLNNIAIQTWFGFSVSSTFDSGAVPQGAPVFSVDARTGEAFVYGDITSQSRRVTTITSGTAFPTVNIGLGDECFRTDLNAFFKYTGATWIQL